jgi:predicted CXXCH cytochrome family protein
VRNVPPRMGAPFARWTNTGLRLVLVALAAGVLGVPALLMLAMRTSYVTMVGNPLEQPVKFDHRHHVRDDGIDCRYCHTTAETQANAGIPPTELCLNCHAQLWTSSPLLAPVRRSFFENTPIPWVRVHVLPDHVYFDHSIHLAKGVGCVSCHGRVDLMAEVAKAAPLTMSWCLDCHRNPAPHLRPREQLTAMEWTPPGDALAQGTSLAATNHVRSLVHCSTCHR